MPDVLRFLPVLSPLESFRSRTSWGLSAGRRRSNSQIFCRRMRAGKVQKMSCALKQSSNLSARNVSAKSFATGNFSVKDKHFGKILMLLSTFCNYGNGNVSENREKDSICLWKQDKGSAITATVRNRKSLCCRKLRSKNVMSTEILMVSDSCQV